jgi:hypothetical protein
MGLVIERDIQQSRDGLLPVHRTFPNDVSKLLAADPFSLVVPFIGVRFSSSTQSGDSDLSERVEEYD